MAICEAIVIDSDRLFPSFLQMLPKCSRHGARLLHLGSEDLKPENIMVSGEKAITLVDFGLAREAGKELEEGREGLREHWEIWERCCFSCFCTFHDVSILGGSSFLRSRLVKWHEMAAACRKSNLYN